jgi:hypothetical protein
MTETAIHLFICLAAAHFLVDYVLQTDEEARKKEVPRILLKHAFLMAALCYLLSGFWSGWHIPVIIFLSHGIIDYVKGWSVKRKAKACGDEEIPVRWSMAAHLLDQAAHMAVILLLAVYTVPVTFYWVDLFGINYLKLMLIITGAVIGIRAGGILIGAYAKPFLDELRQIEKELNPGQPAGWIGFKDGGKVIGQLERGLILLFVLMDQVSAIGFLIAAKSVFRLGEIRERRHGMMAEYIIIGTLMSFGWGLLIAYLTKLTLSYI